MSRKKKSDVITVSAVVQNLARGPKPFRRRPLIQCRRTTMTASFVDALDSSEIDIRLSQRAYVPHVPAACFTSGSHYSIHQGIASSFQLAIQGPLAAIAASVRRSRISHLLSSSGKFGSDHYLHVCLYVKHPWRGVEFDLRLSYSITLDFHSLFCPVSRHI